MLQGETRFTTGIGPLDRRLGGGVPAGSVVALTAPPTSQSELLLYQLAAQQRTLYLSARRTAPAIRDAIERSVPQYAQIHVHAVDRDAPVDDITDLVGQFDASSVVVIDPMDVIEASEPDRLREFCCTLRERLVEADSIAVLHCLSGRDVPDGRDVTANMADVVFQLETERDGDSVENTLAVPKFRGGPALGKALELELTEDVVVDTSRDIA